MTNLKISKGLLSFLLMFFTLAAHAATDDTARFEAKFLDQFSEHHRQAVQMGQMAVEKGHSSAVKNMGKKIVDDQTKEIAQMQKWRDQYYSSIPTSKEGVEKMDMSSMQTATGPQFDQAFLSMMSMHHDSGVKMAQEAIKNAKRPEIRRFAERSVKNQTEEKGKIASLLQKEKSQMSGGSQ